MKRHLRLFAICATLCAAPGASALEVLPGVEKNVSFLFGARSFDPNYWEPIEDHGTISVELDFKPQNWPASFLVGMAVSSRSQSEVVVVDSVPISADFDGSMASLDIGARKYIKLSPSFSLFVDAGVSLFTVEVIIGTPWTPGQTSSDTGFGVFYGCGAKVDFGLFNMSALARQMSGQYVVIFDDNTKTDYLQIALSIGWGF